jgi:hypothetical protein
MTRLLLDRTTNQLRPYPRQDDEPVAGLDRDAAYVVEVVREPEPDEYNPATHYPQPLEPVVAITDPDSDDVNGTATYGWELVPIVPPTPPPNWTAYREGLRDPRYVTIVAAALTSTPKAKYGAMIISAALNSFQDRGDHKDYLDCVVWILEGSALPVAEKTDLASGLLALMTQCNLPGSFITELVDELASGLSSP